MSVLIAKLGTLYVNTFEDGYVTLTDERDDAAEFTKDQARAVQYTLGGKVDFFEIKTVSVPCLIPYAIERGVEQ